LPESGVAADPGSNATSPDRDLPVPVPPINTALRCWAMNTPPARSRTSTSDRRTVELEVVEVLGERQFGDGELVFDRARLLLVDLAVNNHRVLR
jgi:hypothetical protein